MKNGEDENIELISEESADTQTGSTLRLRCALRGRRSFVGSRQVGLDNVRLRFARRN